MIWSDLATVTVAVLLNGTWEDITRYVMTRGGTPIRWREGRQSELGDDSPASGSMVLLNNDHRFTVGNSSSPYYPYWAQGRQVRIREQLGNENFDIYAYLEIPEDTRTSHVNTDRVAVNLVDLLGRMQSMPSFVSTLAEHILYNGGSELQHYWPMSEVSGPTLRNLVGAAALTERRGSFVTSFGATATTGNPVVVYGGAEPLDGDELAGIVYAPAVGGGAVGALRWADHVATLPALSVTSGQSIAIAMWLRWTDTTVDGPVVVQLIATSTYMQITLDSSTGMYALAAKDDTSSDTTQATSIPPNLDAWRLVALRISEPSGLVEFWHHGDTPVEFTLSGAPSEMTDLTGLTIGTVAPAQMLATQIYVGADAYTRTMHLAQVAQGYAGLNQQTTGQRINTLLDYAGIDATIRDIDPGVAVMQPASLADKTPLAALQEAVSTEQGRLFMQADRLTFHDRRHVYNI